MAEAQQVKKEIKRQVSIAKGVQGEQQKKGILDHLQQHRMEALNAGVPENQLPRIDEHMSPQDAKAAQQRLQQLHPVGVKTGGLQTGGLNKPAQAGPLNQVAEQPPKWVQNHQGTDAERALNASPRGPVTQARDFTPPTQAQLYNGTPGQARAAINSMGKPLDPAKGGTNAIGQAIAPVAPPAPVAGNTGVGKVLTGQQGDAILGQTDSDKAVASAAGTGKTVQSSFGTASSTLPSVYDGPLGEAKPIYQTDENGKEVMGPDGKHIQSGVGRDKPVDVRVALKEKHPNIFVAGTPENKAFVEHAKANGTAAALQNADNIVAKVSGAAPAENAAGATPAQHKDDLGQAPTPERLAALNKSTSQAVVQHGQAEAQRDAVADPSSAVSVGRQIRDTVGDSAKQLLGMSDKYMTTPVVNLAKGVADFGMNLVGDHAPLNKSVAYQPPASTASMGSNQIAQGPKVSPVGTPQAQDNSSFANANAPKPPVATSSLAPNAPGTAGLTPGAPPPVAPIASPSVVTNGKPVDQMTQPVSLPPAVNPVSEEAKRKKLATGNQTASA